ncbi:MAG TPA: hypothetical protein VFN79_11470 [Steroidobacteraceae bacterium]|nr:hypothetical protein [Steroidobacteraceae bacterium]
MISNRLSRWTLLFFACALVDFVAAQGLILAGVTWPLRPLWAPGTLIAVHLLAVGWLLLLILGALFQFVPVITSRPLVSQRLSLATLAAVQTGLLAMVGGFLGVTGEVPALAPALPAGGATVLLGVLIACLNVGKPLLRTRPLPLPGRLVLSGLGFLLLTVTLGLSFALALAVPAFTPHLAPLLAGVGDHVLAGIGGWFTLTAIGVSYKLLPMFMLAPEERGIPGDCVHIAGTAGFALALAAGLARIWLPTRMLALAQMTGYAAIALAILIYLGDVARIYLTRKRRALELHNKAAVGAFASLGLATLLALGYLGTARLSADAPMVAFLAFFGWLSGLGLTQLYKIVPFLTWLSRYGNTLGRGAVPPRVQDLVKESHGYPWLVAYFVGVLMAAVAILLGRADAFRFCLGLATLATLGLSLEYWRAWRAHYVGSRTPVAVASRFLHDQRG